MTKRARRGPGRVPLAMATLAGLLFVVLPLAGLVVRAPWSQVADVLGRPDVGQALRLSLVCSLAAAALALLAGLPVAWVLADPTTPGRAGLRALCTAALVLPPVVGGIALLTAFGPQGLVGRPLDQWFGVQLPFRTGGTILAEAFVAFPFVVLTMDGAFRSVDPDTLDAARSFGAGPWARFRLVALPAARPSLLAAAVLAWARALGEFGASITFAGSLPGRTRTLPLAIYEAVATDYPTALVLSLLLVGSSLVVLFALRDRWAGAVR